MSKAALLVIDVINDSFRDPSLSARRNTLVRAINQLVGSFREQGAPIIWIRQEFKSDLSDAFLEMRKQNIRITIELTEGVLFVPGLDVQPADTVIVKKRYSAFFRTNLDEVLAKMHPDLLVVAGINTHACVRTTVIDAYQRDYHTVVAAECTASYDNEHHEITRRYLEQRIARFLSNSEIVDLMKSPA